MCSEHHSMEAYRYRGGILIPALMNVIGQLYAATASPQKIPLKSVKVKLPVYLSTTSWRRIRESG
jgi:hypothetical protein